MSQQQHHRVDPKIWQKFAGDSFTIPKLHSKICYFPRGHLEHVFSNILFTQTLDCRPLVLCTVSAVDLLADPETDQIYAKLLLTPVTHGSIVPLESNNEADDGDDQIVSYAKTLTNTDVRSGGVLYIPKAGADSIFPALPPLDSRNQSRFQDLSVTDVCGVVWKFRHVHRRDPFQHLFTNGWSGFVRKKKLVGGDTVIFIKSSSGNISVGIRRKAELAAAVKMKEMEVNMAIKLAEKNAPFEVVYYPKVGGFDFVMGAKTVEDAMDVDWSCGMRITHMLKNDDTSKGCSIFHGTISAISNPSTHPWRMLQVNWDEPHVPENLKQISPWQVEIIPNTAASHIQFPPTKKLRGAQGSGLSSEIERDHSSIPMIELSFPWMRPLKPTPNCNILNSFKTKIADINKCKTKKTSLGSITLFGQTIQPIESDFNDSSDIIGDDGCKKNNEVEDIDKTLIG